MIFLRINRTKFRAIKRLPVTIRFGPHIAWPQNVRVARQKRCRARFPALRPRPAGSSHGAGPRADVLRGPRKRGALGEGPACPPLRPALEDHRACVGQVVLMVLLIEQLLTISDNKFWLFLLVLVCSLYFVVFRSVQNVINFTAVLYSNSIYVE